MDHKQVLEKLAKLINEALEDEELTAYVGELKDAGVMIQVQIEMGVFIPHHLTAVPEPAAAAPAMSPDEYDRRFAEGLRIKL